MGTSTQIDALGDTLTLPGVAAPPAQPGDSDVSATSAPHSSVSSTEYPTLDSGNNPSSETRGQDVPRSSLTTASARPDELSGACLSDDAILQYRQGELSAPQLEAVDGHLDRCARCRELVELVIADDSPDSSSRVTMFQRGFVVAQRYEIEQFVGKGGMGEVYAATDQMTGRRVALKTVLCTATDDLRAVRKLLDEVVNAQRVAHPHVFKIYDLHEHRDELRGRTPFFTMEFIDGQSLRTRLKQVGALPIPDARVLARQLLAGLGAAHAKGVLHLDFKVDNVMLRNPGGEAVIMDFGLSRASDMQSRQRTSERMQGAGTLPYMSLEQLECRPDLGPASDVYSFGVVLYEVLTGRLPFEAPSFRAILLAQMRERPAPPSRHAPVSAELDAFVMRCLARAPQDRFADAAQALAALERLPRWEKPAVVRMRPRWLGLAALLGGALLALLVSSRGWRGSARDSIREERVLQGQTAAMLAPAPLTPAPLTPAPLTPAVHPPALPSQAADSEREVEVVSAPGGRAAVEAERSAPRAAPTVAASPGPPRASARGAATAPETRAAAARATPVRSAFDQSAPEQSAAEQSAPTPPQPSDWSGPPPQRVPRPRPL
jgi:hypothetical protein